MYLIFETVRVFVLHSSKVSEFVLKLNKLELKTAPFKVIYQMKWLQL